MSMNRGLKTIIRSAVVACAIVLVSCPNPLLTTIEENVSIVVTPPEVLSIFPAANGENVAINLENISVTFSKELRANSVNGTTFKVTDRDGNVVAGNPTVSTDTVTFKPLEDLAYSMVYTVTINGILDVDGNAISEVYTWTFTTGLAPDTENPTGLDIMINNNADYTNSLAVVLEIAAQDNYGVAQMSISNSGNHPVDSGWETFAPDEGTGTVTKNWTLESGDGLKTVSVKFKDGAGNVSTAAIADTIALDTIAPAVDKLAIDGKAAAVNGDSDGGAVSTNQSSVSLILQADDGTGSGPASFEYQLQDDTGAWQPYEAAVTIDPETGTAVVPTVDILVGAGSVQYFQGRLTDVAGNTSNVFTFEVTY